jgi:hypothetical protein
MTKMEAIARALWESWGPWAKFTICAACGEKTYCRSKTGKRYLCVGCFDQGHK